MVVVMIHVVPDRNHTREQGARTTSRRLGIATWQVCTYVRRKRAKLGGGGANSYLGCLLFFVDLPDLQGRGVSSLEFRGLGGDERLRQGNGDPASVPR